MMFKLYFALLIVLAGGCSSSKHTVNIEDHDNFKNVTVLRYVRENGVTTSISCTARIDTIDDGEYKVMIDTGTPVSFYSEQEALEYAVKNLRAMVDAVGLKRGQSA